MKKILIPIDGSENSFIAIDKAKEMAALESIDVVLLFVEDYERHVLTTLPKEYIAAADKKKKEMLENAKVKYADAFNSLEAVAKKGDPASEILMYANKDDIDMVIMGSRGMGTAKRFFLGSVTHKVVLEITKPILIVR